VINAPQEAWPTFWWENASGDLELELVPQIGLRGFTGVRVWRFKRGLYGCNEHGIKKTFVFLELMRAGNSSDRFLIC
jgi:hypothetical protein